MTNPAAYCSRNGGISQSAVTVAPVTRYLPEVGSADRRVPERATPVRGGGGSSRGHCQQSLSDEISKGRDFLPVLPVYPVDMTRDVTKKCRGR